VTTECEAEFLRQRYPIAAAEDRGQMPDFAMGSVGFFFKGIEDELK
jgi:hypothetical protein